MTFDQRLTNLRRPLFVHPFEDRSEALDLLRPELRHRLRFPFFRRPARDLRLVGGIILVRRIQQEECSDVGREELGESPSVESTERVADQEVRTREPRDTKKRSQLLHHILCTPRKRNCVAPAGAGPVVDHTRGEFRHARVDVEVTEGEHPSSGQKDDCRFTRASTMQIEAVATGGVPLPDRGQVTCVC